ncbi:MAG: phosphoribosylanthranilate isomerase [Thermodesulfobacteriota bacterium]
MTIATHGAAQPRVRIKICGVTSALDAQAAVEAGADMIGLNFFPGSKRCVTLERAREIVAVLPAAVWRVGVFVNAARSEIERLRDALALDAIQLHGDEQPEAARGLAPKVIRAVRLRGPDDAARAMEQWHVDYFLCEGDAGSAYGGAGASFDWSWARAVPPSRLFLAGGLTPDNVADAVRTLRPFAIDVASGVESAPGRKDRARMLALVTHAKAA